MELKEAIEIMKTKAKCLNRSRENNCDRVCTRCEILVKVSEILEAYTLVIAAAEKQIAKTPDYEGDGYSEGELVYDTWICPNCGEHYEVGYHDYDYCPKCGQHIQHEDWESE